jgi:hypothetical protein
MARAARLPSAQVTSNRKTKEFDMSTAYAPSKKILAKNLLDGLLDQYGIREAIGFDGYQSSDDKKCLTDGSNFLWCHIDEYGFVSTLTRYAPNGAPGKILGAICEAFETDIFSEYEPQFWGFKTQEEWDAWEAAAAKESDDRFYASLVKYVTDEPNDISPGTIGEIKAKIAKSLACKDLGLVAPQRRAELMQKIESIYDRDHAVRITLSEEEIALARMMARHEDDLPQA